MSRDSRFDKLEHERAEKPATEVKAQPSRFADAPTPGPGTEPVHPPMMEAALENSPVSDPTPQLKRFEADGANHLALDNDELVKLPFRRCPSCERDSSKFDRECIFCHASLESLEARELNLRILATYEADKAKEAETLVEQHKANIKQLVDDEFARRMKEQAETERRWQWNWRLGAIGGAVVCVGIAILWRSFCPSLAFVSFAVALVVIALPPEAREVLTRRVKPRWRL